MRRTAVAFSALIAISAASPSTLRAGPSKPAAKTTAAKPASKPRAQAQAGHGPLAPAVVSALQELSQNDPQVAVRIYYLAAEAYQAQNQPAKALEIYEAAGRDFPQNEDVLNRLLRTYQQMGKTDELPAIAARLAALRPDNPNYIQMLATARFTKGDLAGGLAAWALAVSSHPNDANMHLRYAQALQSHGKGPEAIGEYESAAKLRPDDMDVEHQLAQAYLGERKLDEAKSAYERILASSKGTWAQRDAMRQLLSIARSRNALDKTLAGLEEQASKNPSDMTLQWQLVEGYTLANSTSQLLATLLRAAKVAPEDQELHARLITFYVSQGQWDKAIALRKADAEKNPADANLKMQLGQTYLSARRFKDAAAVFSDAAKMYPTNAVFSEQLAEAHVYAKEYDEAIQVYQDLLGKATEPWRKNNYKARIEQLAKQKQAAQ